MAALLINSQRIICKLLLLSGSLSAGQEFTYCAGGQPAVTGLQRGQAPVNPAEPSLGRQGQGQRPTARGHGQETLNLGRKGRAGERK